MFHCFFKFLLQSLRKKSLLLDINKCSHWSRCTYPETPGELITCSYICLILSLHRAVCEVEWFSPTQSLSWKPCIVQQGPPGSKMTRRCRDGIPSAQPSGWICREMRTVLSFNYSKSEATPAGMIVRKMASHVWPEPLLYRRTRGLPPGR